MLFVAQFKCIVPPWSLVYFLVTNTRVFHAGRSTGIQSDSHKTLIYIQTSIIIHLFRSRHDIIKILNTSVALGEENPIYNME